MVKREISVEKLSKNLISPSNVGYALSDDKETMFLRLECENAEPLFVAMPPWILCNVVKDMLTQLGEKFG